MTHYRTILEDLRATTPREVIAFPPPHEEHMTFEEKFRITHRALTRAKNTSNRILQLTNAFYLGQLLEIGAESEGQRKYYAQQLTAHYRTITKRMYHLFEIPGTEQIMRTTGTTLTTIRLLSSGEYEDLVSESLNVFNGVENLGGSDVTPVM